MIVPKDGKLGSRFLIPVWLVQPKELTKVVTLLSLLCDSLLEELPNLIYALTHHSLVGDLRNH